ncbi:MAG: hypothetical protein HY360_07710 [Verrucomicrobia bacterium]|nr:hypothetical protein [Verrucomicrobiota bacterium]
MNTSRNYAVYCDEFESFLVADVAAIVVSWIFGFSDGDDDYGNSILFDGDVWTLLPSEATLMEKAKATWLADKFTQFAGINGEAIIVTIVQ